ncbi:MAG: hypothetical protein PHQ89_02080 [Bacilli bacterium]|nr:hypothetical protein [Bacilli bacterium]
MNNKKLFRLVGITAAIVIIFTWIIKSSTYDGSAITLGNVAPAGMWDWINGVGISFGYFWQGGLFLLVLGGFYGVISKTGVLKQITTKIVEVFKGKEKMFLIMTTAIFMVIAALTGIYMPLLLLVPFFIAIILAMNYSKMIALVSTVGAIIIGNMCLTYNADLNNALSITTHPNVLYQIILLVVSLGLTSLFIIKTANVKIEKEEINKDLLLEKTVDAKAKKKALWPFITISSVVLVLTILGLTPWESIFGGTVFSDMHNAIVGVKIGSFAIFQNILGSSITALGSWTIIDVVILLVIASILIKLFYKIKWADAIDGFVAGLRKVAPTALLIVVVNIVLIFTLNSGFYTTIMNSVIGLTDKMNIFLMSIITFFGSVLSIDNMYVANYNVSIIAASVDTTTTMSLVALIQQTMYGIAMLIAPTSIILLAGLSYLDVSYTKWLKYIWRLFLILLVAVFVLLIIASLV